MIYGMYSRARTIDIIEAEYCFLNSIPRNIIFDVLYIISFSASHAFMFVMLLFPWLLNLTAVFFLYSY